MITHYDTGQAELVRIVPDLRFGIHIFQSQAHWLYVFNWEAMSGSHSQHRLSLGSVRCSPDPMQLHHVWTLERSASDQGAMSDYVIPHYNTGQADLVRLIRDLSQKVNAFPSWHWLYFFHLGSNVGIARAEQVISRVSKRFTSSYATPSCLNYLNWYLR